MSDRRFPRTPGDERPAVAERPRGVEDLRRAAGQWDPVLALRLHAGRRHRPHQAVKVDFVPCRQPHLARPPRRQHEEPERLLQHWGGPGEGYDWPESNHGIFVDPMDNVWIGGNGGDDSHALKFSHAGEFLLQIT